MTLTREMLLHVFPNAKNVDVWVPALNEAWDRFGFNSKEERASFLAIVGNETGGLVATEENMNYSYSRAAEVWSGKAGEIMRDRVSKGPIAFANWIYAGILGNGDEASGDGWRYVGRGLIGITGKENYRRTGLGIGVDLVLSPRVVMEPKYGALAAAWFMAEYIKIKPQMGSKDESVFIRGANRVGSNNNPKVAAEINERRLRFRRKALEVLIPAGYEKKDGNIKRKKIEDSTIVKDSNKGAIAATVGGATAAVTPIVQAWLSANWQVAAIFAVVVLAAIGGAIYYFTKVKKTRKKMHKDGIA